MRTTLLILAIATAGCAAPGLEDGTFKVVRVVSGDVVELETGAKIRLGGIRAPALGEPLFEAARSRTDQFLVGPGITVEFKFLSGVRDEADRPCALVLVHAKVLNARVVVNTELLEGGLARIDYKTMPAGQDAFFEEREDRARRQGLGVWQRR